PTKVALALEVFETMWEKGEARLKECFRADLAPEEQLRRYAKSGYERQKEIFDVEGKIYGCPIVCAGYEMGAQDEQIRLKSKEIFDRYSKYFEQLIAQAAGRKKPARNIIKAKAHAMFSLALGVLYQAKVANDP